MKGKVQCNDSCEYNGYLYFSNNRYNAMFRMSTETYNIEFVTFFEKEEYYKNNLHSHVLLFKHLLIFIPLCARNIAIYNLDTKEMRYIKVANVEAMISYAYFVDNKLYLIPSRKSEYSLIVDIEKGKIEKNKQLIDAINNITKEELLCDYYGATVYKNNLIIAVFNTGQLLILCREFKKDAEIKRNVYENCKFDNLAIINDEIWITSTTGGWLYKIDKDGNLSKIKVCECDIGRYFFRVCEYKGFLYALPCFGNKIYLSKDSGAEWECSIGKWPEGIVSNMGKDALFMGTYEDQSSLWILPRNVDSIVKYNCEKYEFIPIEIDQESYLKLRKKRNEIVIEKGEAIVEGPEMGLIEFVELL